MLNNVNIILLLSVNFATEIELLEMKMSVGNLASELKGTSELKPEITKLKLLYLEKCIKIFFCLLQSFF
jgi:hypothetical protein